jgi:hypothetical protein
MVFSSNKNLLFKKHIDKISNSTDLYYFIFWKRHMSKSALKILDTAEKLFNENSFVGVGVDLIRDESGCSKTTMYTYYKNKNQLICQFEHAPKSTRLNTSRTCLEKE